MARKWLAFFSRNPSFLKRGMKLVLLFVLSLSFVLSWSSIQLGASVPVVSNIQVRVEDGRKLYRLGRFAEAVAVWEQTLEGYRVNGDVLKQATVLNHLSLAYQKMGDWDEAENAIGGSLTLLLLSETNKASTETLQIIAQALNTQGRLQLIQGQPKEALATWERAMVTYERVGDRLGEIGSLINQAQALEALGFYRRSLKTLLQVEKNLESQDYALQVTGFRSLGIAYRLIGDLDKSFETLNRSLQIAKLYYPFAIAETQLALGNTAQALANNAMSLEGDEAKYQEKLQIAFNFYQQAARAASGKTKLRAELNKLRVLIESKNWKEAQVLASSLESTINSLPPSQLSVNTRINWAESLIQFREVSQKDALEPGEISQVLKEAIAQAKILEDRRGEAYASGKLGHLYEVNQNWKDAEDYTQKALDIAVGIAVPEMTYRWQWQLGRLWEKLEDREKAIAAYKDAVNTLQEIPKNLVALAKNLSTVNSEDDITSDIQFYFRDNVEPVYRQLVDLLLREPNATQLNEARTIIQQLQTAQLEQLLQCNLQTVTAEKIDRVVDRQESRDAVIYPIILGDRIETIIKLPNQPLQHHTQIIPQPEVEQTLSQLSQKLRDGAFQFKSVQRLSERVYSWLIEPWKTELSASGIQTLVFILDSSWQNIPMSVLYDNNDEKPYLIQKYAVVITPPILDLINPQTLNISELKLLLGGLSEARDRFSELPNVVKQIEAISQLEIPSKVLLNRDFNKTAIAEQINFYPAPVVHLATHGQFSSQAKQTFIQTSDGQININELSEFLQGRERTRPEPIELLVLSACETASGDKRSALGLAGVALQSGSYSTLASLWNMTADDSSVVLFRKFYQALQENPTLSKAEALRQAQLALLDDPEWQFPFFWAPYILVGNWL